MGKLGLMVGQRMPFGGAHGRKSPRLVEVPMPHRPAYMVALIQQLIALGLMRVQETLSAEVKALASLRHARKTGEEVGYRYGSNPGSGRLAVRCGVSAMRIARFACVVISNSTVAAVMWTSGFCVRCCMRSPAATTSGRRPCWISDHAHAPSRQRRTSCGYQHRERCGRGERNQPRSRSHFNPTKIGIDADFHRKSLQLLRSYVSQRCYNVHADSSSGTGRRRIIV